MTVIDWINSYDGLWGFIQVFALVATAALGIRLIWFPSRRIPQLNITTGLVRDSSPFPLRINVHIRNYTGRSVVLVSHGFYCNDVRPMPGAAAHSETGMMEVKFPVLDSPTVDEDCNLTYQLNTMEYLLEHRKHVSSWIPVDPSHTDAEVNSALKNCRAGRLELLCVWLFDKPKVQRLNARL